MVARVMMSDTKSVNAWSASAVSLSMHSRQIGLSCIHITTLCCLRLRIEHHPSSSFANRHAQVDIQSNPRYPHARIALVTAGKIGIVMMVVMTM